VAAHGIAESALLTHFLEETGTGICSKDDIEQVEREAAFIAMAEGWQGKRELGLLDIAGFGDNAGGFLSQKKGSGINY
jgi:hypothetical protein